MFGIYNRLRVNIHASNREVIRAASRKLKSRFNPAERDARHTFYRAMIGHHTAARKLAQRFRL